MDPLEWARRRKSEHPREQPYRRRGQPKRTDALDGNELAKYAATLRRRGLEEFKRTAATLAEGNGDPIAPFGRRNGNEYLGRFRVLRDHVVMQLPREFGPVQALRGLIWLRRLEAVEEADRKANREGHGLLEWLL